MGKTKDRKGQQPAPRGTGKSSKKDAKRARKADERARRSEEEAKKAAALFKLHDSAVWFVFASMGLCGVLVLAGLTPLTAALCVTLGGFAAVRVLRRLRVVLKG